MHPSERRSPFIRETITGPEEGAITFSPERGGIVTSLKLGGVETLYLDEATFADGSKNVRGGIPILFPNAGPLAADRPYHLEQHGFARKAPWSADVTPTGFVETLASTPLTREVFPFDFSLELRAALAPRRAAFRLILMNKGTEMLPVAGGLHPYFRVPAGKKNEIEFLFAGGEAVRQEFDVWSEGGTTSIPNPGELKVRIPGTGDLILLPSPEFRRIWVWSLPGEDFVCIEPVMREKGGLADDPELVPPGNTLEASFDIALL